MDKKEFDKGYQEAINQIKAALQGGSNSGSGGAGGSETQQMDPRMKNIPVGGNGSGKDSKSKNNQSQIPNPSGNNSKSSNQSRGNGEQGVVRPEDCTGPSQLKEIPGVAGGIMDSNAGNDIAEAEGHERESMSDDAIERDWKDAAMKAINKLPGKGAGAMLRGKIENLYKTSTNWKKELRAIVGHAINPDDGRQAYANKNVLVSQDRIARTVKDKYDNVSYITAFIDTSGSMSQEQYLMCLREVYSMALMKKPMNIVVIQCDTRITDVAIYRNIKEMERSFKTAKVKGGGGTELKPCWDYLKNDPKMKRIPSELVMVFTDGYLTQYRRDPKTMQNLCWVIIDNPAFNIENKDIHTKVVYIKSEDVK